MKKFVLKALERCSWAGALMALGASPYNPEMEGLFVLGALVGACIRLGILAMECEVQDV